MPDRPLSRDEAAKLIDATTTKATEALAAATEAAKKQEEAVAGLITGLQHAAERQPEREPIVVTDRVFLTWLEKALAALVLILIFTVIGLGLVIIDFNNTTGGFTSNHEKTQRIVCAIARQGHGLSPPDCVGR